MPPTTPFPRLLAVPLLCAATLGAMTSTVATPARAATNPSYTNPLPATRAGGRPVENCADPSVIRSQTPGDDAWYMYCTSDALADDDRDPFGNLRTHLIPTLRSTDLVHWTHVGDAFAARPAWAEPGANLWSPEIQHFGGRYLLYYAATNTRATSGGEPNCGDDSAIGVATAPAPTGPWTDLGRPLIPPRRAGPGCDFKGTIDPEVIEAADGTRYVYYGSFNGGIEVRVLSPDGLSAPAATTTPVTAASRYEGALVLQRDGFYYLLVSAADCCRGPLTGYGVFAGRSASPSGPFVDAEGASLLDARVGGTPVLAMNGNGWVGPGHATEVTDAAGQDWLIYHAIEEDDPYFEGAVGYTRRPVMLDALDWEGGWPRVAWGPSADARVAPATAGGAGAHAACARPGDAPGTPLAAHSDEFEGGALDPRWSWVRPPAPWRYDVGGGVLRFATRAEDLYGPDDSASVLVQDAPAGDYLVETKLHLDLPASGCCHDYVQAGVTIYGDDDNYVRLDHVSIGGTRQVEFAKEQGPVPAGYPFFGGTLGGPPAETTWLRVARRQRDGAVAFTAYSSRDGQAWSRGGTWTHDLGGRERIGLLAMGGDGFTARFDYVRVSTLAPFADPDAARAGAADADLDGLADGCAPDDDGDGLADALDCAPFDAAGGTPEEIARLDVEAAPAGDVEAGPAGDVAGGARVHWTAARHADAYDLLRPRLRTLAPGPLGPCLADGVAGTVLDDPEHPAAGDGFGYLVRGVNAICGAGPYGHDRTGACP